MIEIDEAIADAMAEEEAKKEGFMIPSYETKAKITIDLEEYIDLRIKERDFSLIMSVITEYMGLDYRDEDIYFRGNDQLTDAIKLLYPDTAKIILDELKAKKKAEKEGDES